MTKAPISLQDLRRRLYIKAKTEPTWRFWGLYVHVCKGETLREAYRQAKANDGAPGIDGVTFAAVEAGGTEEFLDQLRQELVQRTYRPQKARKVEDPTALVLDHEEAVQHTETQRGHGEKVEGGDHLAVVLEECPPALHLRLVGLALQPLQIARHGGYRNLKSEVQQFPVDARRSLTAPRQANSQNELPICPPTATVPETGTPENSA